MIAGAKGAVFQKSGPIILLLCVAVASSSTAQDCESMQKKMRDLSLYHKAVGAPGEN